MAQTLADLLIKLGFDTSGVQKGTTAALKDLATLEGGAKGVGANLKILGGNITSAGKTLTKNLTLPIVGFGVLATARFETVNKKLREVNTLTGEVGTQAEKDFASFQKGVAGLSAELGIAQDTLASGLYDTLSAGVPKDNAIEFLRTSSKLAVAGVTDTATAVDGLTTVINAYGLDSKQAGMVSDQMFTAMKMGKQTVEQISGSLFQVAGTARNSGVSFDQVAAAMATMTSKGTPASVATTQLRQALVEMQKPGDNLQKTFESLGVKGWDQLIKRKGSMQAAFQAIRKEAEANGLKMTDLFGSVEATNAVLSLTGPNAKDAAKALAGMKGAAGATAKGFAEMDKARSIDRMKIALDNMAISVGGTLAPYVSKAAGFVSNLAEKFDKLSPGVQKFIVVAGMIAAVVGPVLIFVGMLISAIGAIIPVIGAVVGVISVPFLLIAAGVAIAVAAGILLYKNWDKVKGWLIGAWDAIKSAASSVFSWIKDFVSKHAVLIATAVTGPIGGLVVWLIRNWDTVKSRTSAAWQGIKAFLSQHAVAIVTAITGPIGGLVAWTIRNWGAIRQGVATAWSTIRTTASAWASNVVNAITGAIGAVTGKVAAVWTSVRTGLASAWGLIKTSATSWAGNVVSAIVSALGGLVGKAKAVGSEAGSALASALKAAVNAVIDKIRGFSLPTIKIAGKTIPGSGASPFSGLPRLAQGGLAFGPTLAVVGDNKGARSNPEVIAPLDRLETMMGGGSGIAGDVSIEIKVDRVANDYDVRRMGRLLVEELRLQGVTA